MALAPNPVDAYALDVVEGRLLAGKYHRLACKRHLADRERENAPGFPFRFDWGQAQRFLKFAGLMKHYKGRQFAIPDLVGGQIQLMFDNMPSALPMAKEGKIRALAVTTSKRSTHLPDVPTIAESGYAGFDAPAWWAVLAPAKTPPEIVKRMNEELNAALKTPEVAAKLAAQGIATSDVTPAAAQAFIERQIDTWATVVKANGIKADQ